MTIGTGVVSAVRVSHGHASVEEIEAACTDTQRGSLETALARPDVEEAFCLQTCHRSEMYVVTADAEAGREALSEFVADVPEEALVRMDHEGSLRHLLGVATGLESLVLGEDQILGQVRRAIGDARAVGAIGPVLDEGLTKALHVGERARTETAINEGTVSIGSAAARFATQEQPPEAATALVIGAGDGATPAAEALAGRVDRLLVTNRTCTRAKELAGRLDGEALALADLPAALDVADVVVSATRSPETIVDPSDVQGSGETLVIDIARPRDVAPAVDDLPNATRYDLDTLDAIIDDTHAKRRAAAEEVEAMVDEEFARLLDQYKRKRADEVIGAMYESAEQIKARELHTTFSKLDGLDDEQRATIESMADALVGQLLAAPTESLRDAAENDDWTTINTALQLFDPEFGSEPPTSLGGVRPEDLPEELQQAMPPPVLEQLQD